VFAGTAEPSGVRKASSRLHPHEFIRRFLMHVLPKGFHRIRHYGLFANANRAESIEDSNLRMVESKSARILIDFNWLSDEAADSAPR